MQGHRTCDVRRTPRAEPWQPHGSGGDLRWEGRRKEEKNVPVQSDHLMHSIGQANKDKVQASRETGQVTLTVTHNTEDGRRHRLEG